MKKRAIGLLMICAWTTLTAHAKSPLDKVMMAHFNEKKAIVQTPTTSLKQERLDKYQLILFFSNQCPHCVKFAPVLKGYAEAHQWQIEAISLNGQSLPEFPHALFATQAMIDVAYQGKPVTYPALFIANTETHALYPVSFGELSEEELELRMDTLTHKIQTYEETH